MTDSNTADAPAPDPKDRARALRLARLFDIRRIIGGVFTLYGVVLVVTGIVGSHEVKNKAAGIDVDLWTGLAMLVVAAAMLAWATLRPINHEPSETAGSGAS